MTIYVRPTITPHKTAETHQNSPRKIREGTQNSYFNREGRQGDREHDGRSRVTTDYLGSVDPDVAPGAEPLADSSPGTAAAAGVEVVSAPNREGNRDRLKHLFSVENLSKHRVWNDIDGCDMNMCISEAAIPQIVAIRYCTLRTFFSIRVPPFRYLGCVLQCAVFPQTCAHHVLRSLLLFFQCSLVSLPINSL